MSGAHDIRWYPDGRTQRAIRNSWRHSACEAVLRGFGRSHLFTSSLQNSGPKAGAWTRLVAEFSKLFASRRYIWFLIHTLFRKLAIEYCKSHLQVGKSINFSWVKSYKYTWHVSIPGIATKIHLFVGFLLKRPAWTAKQREFCHGI
jgi:hypothetical protein